MNTLNITQDELALISKVAQDVKFKHTKEDFVYPNTYKDKMKSFIKCYRFLQNLSLNLDDNDNTKPIREKIIVYIKNLDVLYNESEFLINSIKKDLHFGNNIMEDKIKNLIYENNLIINQVLDEVFPIGRRLVLYDPDSAAGIL